MNAERATFPEVMAAFDASRSASSAFELMRALYPICRSITGEGLRRSLRMLAEVVPLTIHEVPSGTPVFDWTVPNEWNIRDAYIRNSRGERVVDFRHHNLHVVNYSIPVNRRMTLQELRPHLHTIPAAPEWIPYRTSYYRETWGFCLSQHQFDAMTDHEYDVCIDATLAPGRLSYGELVIRGASDDEVLISCHSCHPSLGNDNLTGMTIAAELARALGAARLRNSYRFLWLPGTIGAIAWLATHESELKNVKHGLVLSCLGDPGAFTYKRSRRGDADIDRAVEHVLRSGGQEFRVREFTPYGYDERQYCSPGINLPVGCLMRTPNGEYPEYHTSADDLSLIRVDAVAASLRLLMSVVQILEENDTFLNLHPKCEPQLGRRGLYGHLGGVEAGIAQQAMLWVLNYSDGGHDLLDIASRAGVKFDHLSTAARALQKAKLITRHSPSPYDRD